jgi:hypothetical protein
MTVSGLIIGDKVRYDLASLRHALLQIAGIVDYFDTRPKTGF